MIQKKSFYEELEQDFYHVSNHHMTVLLGDFNAKLGKENIFKPTVWNESLHQENNNNAVRIVNFASSVNLVVKTRCSLTETFISTPGPLMMRSLTTSLITY